MRVANLISFSWTSLRLDLYSFSSSVSSFFSFAVRSLVLGLVLELLDLLALVDDRLDDVVAQRAPALDALDGGHRLGVVQDAAQRVVVHVHEQRALPLAGQQRGRGARHRDVEDAARVDLRHVRAVVGQHRQERHEILDRVLRVRLIRREADPVLGELPQRARGREVEHEADGLEDLLLVVPRPAQSSAANVAAGVLLDLAGDPLRQAGGDVVLAGVVEVLRLEVVELVVAATTRTSASTDASGAPPASPSSTPHSISRPTIAASTSTFGSICAGGRRPRRPAPPSRSTLVMPNDDPARDGLTKTGRPSRSLSASESVTPARSTAYGPTGMPSAAAELLGELLVHGGGGGEHVRPDVGDAGHLQHALDGAVLAVGAVQHREDHVDVGRAPGRPRSGRAPSARRRSGRPGSTTAAPDSAVISGSRRPLIASWRGVTAGQHPAALPGDADRHHLELVGVERAEDAAGADAGDGVLGAAAAEDDGHAGLAWGGHSGHLFVRDCGSASVALTRLTLLWVATRARRYPASHGTTRQTVNRGYTVRNRTVAVPQPADLGLLSPGVPAADRDHLHPLPAGPHHAQRHERSGDPVGGLPAAGADHLPAPLRRDPLVAVDALDGAHVGEHHEEAGHRTPPEVTAGGSGRVRTSSPSRQATGWQGAARDDRVRGRNPIAARPIPSGHSPPPSPRQPAVRTPITD